MAKYTRNRKYSKKPTVVIKKITKRVKKETIESVYDSTWQKTKDWFKGLFKFGK